MSMESSGRECVAFRHFKLIQSHAFGSVSSERLHEVTEPAAVAQLARYAFRNAVADSAPSSPRSSSLCTVVFSNFRGGERRRAQKVPSTEPLRSSKVKAFSSISVWAFRWFIFSATFAALICSSRLHSSLRGSFPFISSAESLFPAESHKKKLVSSNVNEICSGASRKYAFTGDI